MAYDGRFNGVNGMRFLSLALLAFSLFAPLQAETLRVMSFNVRMPNYVDGVNYWDSRRD